MLNNTKVIPARLLVKRGYSGQVELLLLKRNDNDVWEALAKPGRSARLGQRLVFGNGLLKAEVISISEEGNRHIKFDYKESLKKFLMS